MKLSSIYLHHLKLLRIYLLLICDPNYSPPGQGQGMTEQIRMRPITEIVIPHLLQKGSDLIQTHMTGDLCLHQGIHTTEIGLILTLGRHQSIMEGGKDKAILTH